jgi:hypothetical protein
MVVFAAWCLHVLEDLPAALALHSSTGQPVRSSVGKDTPGGPQHHPSAATHSESAAGSDDSDTTASQGSSALINTLAFAPDLLLKLWRWLAVVVGLPLEAPLEASRGLDVAAVAGGARGLPAQHALVLGVFCRWVDMVTWEPWGSCLALSRHRVQQKRSDGVKSPPAASPPGPLVWGAYGTVFAGGLAGCCHCHPCMQMLLQPLGAPICRQGSHPVQNWRADLSPPCQTFMHSFPQGLLPTAAGAK